METDNVFSDQMQVSRPQFCILFRAVSVCIITDSRDIVCQRVKPYINDMLIVKINRNSPLKRSSGYAQILKSCLLYTSSFFLLVILKLFLLFSYRLPPFYFILSLHSAKSSKLYLPPPFSGANNFYLFIF